jgi:hypothetical protein
MSPSGVAARTRLTAHDLQLRSRPLTGHDPPVARQLIYKVIFRRDRVDGSARPIRHRQGCRDPLRGLDLPARQLGQRHAHLLGHSGLARVDLLVLVVLAHGGPLPRGVLGGSPEYLPHGRTQVGTATSSSTRPGTTSIPALHLFLIPTSRSCTCGDPTRRPWRCAAVFRPERISRGRRVEALKSRRGRRIQCTGDIPSANSQVDVAPGARESRSAPDRRREQRHDVSP